MDLNSILTFDNEEFEKNLFERSSEFLEGLFEKKYKNNKYIYEEMICFDKKIIYIINKYNIDYLNPIDFINKICNIKEHELQLLLLVFLIDYEYLYTINKKVKNSNRIKRFLYIKEQINNIKIIINNSKQNNLKYNEILNNINKKGNLDNVISKEKLDFIKKVFNKYVSFNCPLDINIEYIHSLIMGCKETQSLYPLLLFKILIKFKSKICKENIFINLNTLLKYKSYSILLDNGKNFKMYYNYVNMFLEMVEGFSDICNKELCLYGFYKSSNLVEWLFRSTLNTKVFNNTVLALVEEKYITSFQNESIYLKYIDDDEYIDFKIEGMKTNEFFSTVIENELTKGEVICFMNNYTNNSDFNEVLIEKIKTRIFNKFNLTQNNNEDKFYILKCFEMALISRGDNYIKDRIIEFMES